MTNPDAKMPELTRPTAPDTAEIKARDQQGLETKPETNENPQAQIKEIQTEMERHGNLFEIYQQELRDQAVIGNTQRMQELEDKIQKEKTAIQKFGEQKYYWLDQYGEDQLPEGTDIDTSEDETKIKILKAEVIEATDPEKEKEARREFVEEWKTGAVKTFSQNLRTGWRTKNAINLELVLKIVANNVPLKLEQSLQDYLQLKTDELPNTIWISWKHNSILQSLSGKPNQIREIELWVDQAKQIVAGENELIDAQLTAGNEDENIDNDSETSPNNQNISEGLPEIENPELKQIAPQGVDTPANNETKVQ